MGAHSKSTGYARYVGRLGALAVALGVGTMPGLAWAIPETGDQADTVDSPPSVPTPLDPTAAVTPEPTHDSSSPSLPTGSPGAGTGPTTNSSQITVSVGDGSSPPVTVSGSGSLNTTINGEQTSTEPTKPTKPTKPKETKGGDHGPVETAKTVTLANAPGTANQNEATATTSAPKIVATPASSAVVALKTVEPQSFTSTAQPVETIITTPAPEPAHAQSTVNVVAKMVSAVLAPLLLPSPESPAAPALMWAVLAWTRRESERTTTAASESTLTALTTTSEPATPEPAARTASLLAAPALAVQALVTSPNNAPTASPTITNVDGTTGIVTGNLNAVDPNGDPLTYTIKTPPAKGAVGVTTTGAFTYTPTDPARHAAAATAGADVDGFIVNVSDGRGAVTAVRVSSVPVTPANTAPITGTVTVGNPNSSTGVVTGTVRATDADRDALTYTGSTATARGAVVVNANGTFTYTPTAEARHQAAAGGAANDSFTVTANDGHGGTVAVAVAVAVGPKNAAPKNGSSVVGQPDAATGVVTGAVTASDADGDTLQYSGPTSTAKGSVVVNTDGTFTYTPTAAARHQATAGGAAASDSFTVTANDGHGGTLAVAVKVAVSPQNSVPKNGSATVGSPDATTGVVTGTVSATDTDGDNLTFTGSRSTTKGSVVVNANGTFTYTPTATAQHNASAGGAAASDSFTVTASDGHGGTLAVPVIVAVNPKNATPIGGTVTVGNPNSTTGVVTGTVRATDADRDALTYTGSTSTAKGAVIVNANGTFTYTPTAIARHEALAGGAAATDSFTVTASDGHGGTVAVAVNVTVSPKNAAPKNGSAVVGTPDPATGMVTGSVSATDADGDTVRYSGPTSTAKGNVAVNTDGTFTYTPTELARHKALAGGAAATDTFTITASDSYGGTLAVAVTVNISPKNAAPANPTIVVAQPNSTTGIVTGTVKALDPDGDTVRYSGTATTAKGSVTVTTSGAFTYTPTAAAQHAASAGGAAATDTFTVTATDQYGAALPVTVTVTVNPKNRVPINGVATVGQPDSGSGVVTGTVSATDPDGDTLKYSGSTTTGKGTVIVNENGSFTYTPTAEAQHAASQGGTAAKDAFAITADDGHGGALAIQVSVNVNPKNAAPVAATAPSVGNPNSAGVVTGKINVTDADGDSLSYQVVTGPTRGTLTIDSATGTYTYTAKPEERLNASLTTNAVETDSFTIGVTDGRSAPIVVTVGDVLVAELPANSVTGTPGVGDGPRAVVLSADGTRAYVANTDDDTVTVINTTNNTTVRTIQVGDRPTALALNTAGSTLYVANAGGNSVTSINTATGAVITTVGIGHEPTGITVSPDGQFLYTANADNTITIVTVASGTSVSVGIDPSQIVINQAGTRVYALNSTDGDVSIIDSSNGTVLDTIHVGDDTFGMAISPDDTHLYLTKGGTENRVAIVQLSDKSFTYADVGFDPRGIAVTPDGKRLYVANFGSDSVSIVDLTDNNAVTFVNVGDGPWGVSIDATGTRATVTNSLSDTVTVILIAGNEPPVLHPTQSTNFSSGVVTGSLGATDGDGDALSYSTTQGTLGGVTIDGAGNYVYTPTPAARHAAAVAPATDTFTVTVGDGHGSSVTKTISVSIAPANEDPIVAPVASSPADGVVTIDLHGSDPDGDAVTYTVVAGPARGTLAVLAPGQFRYTPTDTARSDAA
ncbi:MAG: large repetitive protein, partial [Mycobacterium sp.]|nr:large repetitive protein [Mycobacterium sp.]